MVVLYNFRKREERQQSYTIVQQGAETLKKVIDEVCQVNYSKYGFDSRYECKHATVNAINYLAVKRLGIAHKTNLAVPLYIEKNITGLVKEVLNKLQKEAPDFRIKVYEVSKLVQVCSVNAVDTDNAKGVDLELKNGEISFKFRDSQLLTLPFKKEDNLARLVEKTVEECKEKELEKKEVGVVTLKELLEEL